MVRFVASILLLAAGVNSFGGPEPSAVVARLEAGRPVTIVCFGDSLTGVYYHTGGHRAWPDLLGAGLRELYPTAALTVINAGVSGNTTGQALARMQTDVIAHHPDLAIVMFSLNDMVRGKGPDEFRSNLKLIIGRARAAHIEVVLMTPNTILPGDPDRLPQRVGDYVQIMREVANAEGVALADAYRGFEAVRAADERSWQELMSQAIHPNLFGDVLFAESAISTLTARPFHFDGLPPLANNLGDFRARAKTKRVLRIVAMKPLDETLSAVLNSLYPDVEIRLIPWESSHLSLPDLAEHARALDRFKGNAPDLVVLAIPSTARAGDAAAYFREYSAVLNAVMDFGPGGWECLAVSPEVVSPGLDAGDRTNAAIARRVCLSKDILWVERAQRDVRPAADLLAEVLR